MRINLTANGSHADAVINIASIDTLAVIQIEKLAFSYNGAPTAGQLLVKDGKASDGTVDGASVTLLDLDITDAGPGPFGYEVTAPMGRGMNITLKDGGVGVVGKINAVQAG